MNRLLDISYRTMVAELLDRALDAQFDQDFDEAGAFIKVTSKARQYWYYKPSLKDGRPDTRTYVGPVEDVAITERVNAFRQLKNDFQARRKMVSTLSREARLFTPDRAVGDTVEALWKAGVFRLRGCLVGTVAFQTYGAALGYRLDGAALQTGDIDIAQFHSISVAVADSIPPVMDVLKEIEPSFRPVPALNDRAGVTRFTAQGGLRVEFLTPNTSSEDHVGQPATMPALGGAAAEPLRFLDFLIYQPIRTVMLHKGGIPVTVPDPSRFAIHKLIVSSRRMGGTGKDEKDLRQSEQLIQALEATGRMDEVYSHYHEARDRGPAWRDALDRSLKRMPGLGLRRTPELLASV